MSAWERIPLEVQTPLTDAIRSGEIIVCASPRRSPSGTRGSTTATSPSSLHRSSQQAG